MVLGVVKEVDGEEGEIEMEGGVRPRGELSGEEATATAQVEDGEEDLGEDAVADVEGLDEVGGTPRGEVDRLPPLWGREGGGGERETRSCLFAAAVLAVASDSVDCADESWLRQELSGGRRRE